MKNFTRRINLDFMKGSYLGPSFSDAQIENILKKETKMQGDFWANVKTHFKLNYLAAFWAKVKINFKLNYLATFWATIG